VTHRFFDARRPLAFAHRGGSGLAPENTIAAFDNGLALGADGLELDVRLSKDGVVVLHHDRRLDRTTNLSGHLASFTAAELSRADAGFRFQAGGTHPFRGAGLGVPTLEEVLGRYRDCRIIIEMKVNHLECARKVIDIVRAADAVDRVCLGSFGWRVLKAARELEPAVATSAAREEVRLALYRSWCRWPVSRVRYNGYQIPEHSGGTRVVSARFVEEAHRAGLGVQVWTVDTEATARRLLSWKVGALITDRPDVIVPLCASGGQTPV
jgi:glycerophosphoryl diester phosphodiesterase